MRILKEQDIFEKKISNWNVSRFFIDIFVWLQITVSGGAQFDVGILKFYPAAKVHNLSCSKCAQLSELKSTQGGEELKVHKEQLELCNMK